MLRVYVAEDSPQDADVLRGCIRRFCEEEGIEVDVRWERDALGLSQASGQVDLVFLDIDLPLEDGLEAAGLLRVHDAETPVIFVTNLANQAVRGYEVSALDFIVKPVRYPDFRMRMQRAMRVVRRRADQRLVVDAHGTTRVVSQSELVFAETSGHDVALHLQGEEEPLLARGTLAELERRLDPGRFVRLSRSCVVNMAYIRSVHGSQVGLVGGQSFAVGRARRAEALATISRYLGRSI